MRYVLPEFPLGSQFCADIVILNAYSGVWQAFFIELEPVDDPVFTKAGIPSNRLATAIRQVDDWRAYIQQNHDTVRRDLVRWAMERDTLRYSSKPEPFNYSGDYLADPRTRISIRYKVVIGRSSGLGREVRERMGRYTDQHDIELVSYDRLLRLAERRYGGAEPSQSHAT